MKRAYTQLTEKERQEIARLHLLGWSRRAIGRTLPRAHSTVLREVRRHQGPGDRYRAEVAAARAYRHRHQRRTARKLAHPGVRQTIRAQLARRLAPAGALF